MNVLNKKLAKTEETKLDVAIKYYKVLMAVNGKSLTEMEFNMLGFLAVYGTITTPPNRERFINTFSSTQNSINTMISNMYKKGLIEKRNGKNIIKEELKYNFDNPIMFNILLLSKDLITEPREESRDE